MNRTAPGRPALELVPSPGRVPPHDLDSEALVVASVFIEPAVFEEVALVLRGEHFYSDSNRRVWEAIVAVASSGRTPDVVAVAGWLRDQGRLDQIGGNTYLAQLADDTPATAKPTEHAQRIADKFRLRQVIATSQTIAAEGYGVVEDVGAFAMNAEARLYAVAQDTTRKSYSIAANELMKKIARDIEARRNREVRPGASTGFKSFDRRIGWLHPGRMYLCGARPGIGKTALLMQAGRSVMLTPSEKQGCFFGSIEMSNEDIGKRIATQEAMVDGRALEAGMLTDEEYSRVTAALTDIAKWPMITDDTPRMNVTQLRSAVRRAQRRFRNEYGTGLGLVGIDYLQLMGRDDAPGGRSENDDLTYMSNAIVGIAKEFEVPVILLSQLNRKCEERPDKRPILSDLRGSGSLEQDAWAVFFLYREDYYRKSGEQKDNQGEFIVAKARGGACGVTKVGFIPRCSKFVDQEDDDRDDEFAQTALRWEAMQGPDDAPPPEINEFDSYAGG